MANTNIEINQLNRKELIEVIEQLTIYKKKTDLKLKKITNQNKALKIELETIHTQNSIVKNKRAENRNKLEAKNIEYLERALSVFEDFLDRPFEPKDYRKFKRYLTTVYPRPAYIQEPKLTKEEKQLSPELQIEARELKRRTGWSETRLRKFYKERTRVKPSTKK